MNRKRWGRRVGRDLNQCVKGVPEKNIIQILGGGGDQGGDGWRIENCSENENFEVKGVRC